MQIDKTKLPNHIAIILDGNGRWAKKRLLPRSLGHKEGAKGLKDIALYANKIGIKYLTVFCFSTENWKRPKDEVNYLMTEPIKYYKKYHKQIIDSNIKIKIIGKRNRLSSEMLNCLNDVEKNTINNTGLTLTLAIDYGSRDEIASAARNIAKLLNDNMIELNDIDEKLISTQLYTKDLPDVDLLIRTSGECRISNFLLWQIAYAELYFTKVYWPDFNSEELDKAIIDYQSRSRRYGGLK